MRRAVVTTAATAAGVVLLLSFKPHQQAAPLAAGGGASSSTSSSSSGSAGASGASGSSGTSGSSGSSGKGTTTGSTVQTRYGPVQVQVIRSGGRITRVRVLQAPTGNPRDEEINNFALPQLQTEVLKAQSAKIDAVSGATFTSDGYIQSLQSALDGG